MLEVLICTIGERIDNVPGVFLRPLENVRYLVSWQCSGDEEEKRLPEAMADRPDVRVVTMRGEGLSANRNNAIRNARGDILLISDDDARYREEYFETIIRSFEEYPQADILTFRIKDENGGLFRQYADRVYEYRERPRFCSSVRSLEIAFRRSSAVPDFDVRFGLGSAYLACGEEEVFVHQASLSGLRVLYIPKVIAQTRSGSTGSRFRTDAKVRRSKGAVLFLFHGMAGALLRSIKFALCSCGGRPTLFVRILADMCKGISYVRKTSPA